VPHLLLGVLLVLACAVGALALILQLGGSRPVLATARAVTVGQALTAADLRQVSLPADSDVRAVDAASAASLIGRPVAVSLPAGALLTPESFGGAGAPPPGQAIVAVADPGRLPLEVTSGDRVSVIAAPSPANGGTEPERAVPRSWPGVVASVEPSDIGQLTVVSVQLPEGPAREIAAVPQGQLAVVLMAAGG
jgi:Flp pilus assembly protein CpaB